MATLQRCPSGHFFDSSKASECPVCSQSQSLEFTVRNPSETKPEPPAAQPPLDGFLVGWLVDVKSGKTFGLRGERCFVGSTIGMDVCLTDDPEVFPKHHAVITYDSKKLRFKLAAGPDYGRVVHNDVALEPRAVVGLSTHDIVEFGRTKLVFVALCGEQFQWPA